MYSRLQYGSWDEKDGAVDIDTDITAAEEIITSFYIYAEGQNNAVVTDTITVTLSCIDVTSVTTTYKSNTEDFVVAYTENSHLFKIYITDPGTTETVDLNAVVTYATDRPNDCDCLGLVLVTDSSGATDSTDSKYSISNFILTVSTNAAIFDSIFLKATSYVDTAFSVDKVLVSVCGNQIISNDDTSNAFFTGIEDF